MKVEVDRFDRSPEAKDRAVDLVAKCKDVVSHPWARMIAEKAQSGTQADDFVKIQLGWPNEVARQVRALTYLRMRFPEFYQEHEDISQRPGMRMFTFYDEPVERLTAVVRKPLPRLELVRVPVFAEKSFKFGSLEVPSQAPLLLGELAAGKPEYNTYDTDPGPMRTFDSSHKHSFSGLVERKPEAPTYKRYLEYKGIGEDSFYGLLDNIASWAYVISDLEGSDGWDLRFVNANAHMMPEPDKFGRFEFKVATRIYDPYEEFPPKVFRRGILCQVVDVAGLKVCNRVRLLLRRDFGPNKDFAHSKDVLGQMTYERFVILDEVSNVTVAVLKTSYDVTKDYQAQLIMKGQERHPRIGIQDFPYLGDEPFKKVQRHTVHNLDAKDGIEFLTPTLALFQDMDYQFFRVDLERIFGATFLVAPPDDLLSLMLPTKSQ